MRAIKNSLNNIPVEYYISAISANLINILLIRHIFIFLFNIIALKSNREKNEYFFV